jgi:RNA polymerase sigma-70 factor (ECF subfamily)
MKTEYARFTTTNWTSIFLAQDARGDAARQHLERLVERYWRPVYCFIRHKGRSHADAADATQQFFTEFIEKDIVSYADRARGKFRTFLLASVSRFLALLHRTASRRPVENPLPIADALERMKSFEPSTAETAERAFERNWAKALIDNCLAVLREECIAQGKELQYRAFAARFLKDRSAKATYGEIAGDLGVSEDDVDNLIRRAKKRFKRILREEVSGAAMTPEDIDKELALLLSHLSAA